MIEALLAPLRVVLHRSAADWLIVGATWLVIVCATTLLAIGVLYGDAVALSGLRQVLSQQPAGATSVTVQMRVDPEQLAAVDEVVRRQARRILSWTDGELARVIRSGTYDFPESVTDAADTDLTAVSAIGGLEGHAAIVSGAWPAAGGGPLEVAVSKVASGALGLSVGDEFTLTSRAGADRTLDVRVVGTWEPNDADEPFWLGDGLEVSGVSQGPSFTVRGPLVVTPEDLIGTLGSGDVDVTWRVLPEFDNLALGDVRSMRSDTVALERRIGTELGADAFFSVTTGLPEILGDADRSLLVSRSGVLLLTIQFTVLAAYALVLVAGLLVEERRVETALLRSRGASAGHVAAMAFLEGLLLVIPAALAAPWIALGALRAFDAVGPLTAAGVRIQPQVELAALIVAAAAGLACLIGLVVPAFASGRGLAAVQGSLARQGNRTLAQRLGIDLALVVLAGIGLWQLRQYGAPLTATVRGTIGLDPLLVAAPAIGLLAGAILALRVVPLTAELAERVLGNRRGLVASLGARQLARRPLRYTRSALLLMLAAALGIFAATYTNTWTRSQADQAAYQSGGDLRVDVSSFPDLPLWALGPAYSGVDGVERAMPVVLDTFDVSGDATGGQLMALGTAALPEVADVRADLLDGLTLEEVASLLAPDTDGLATAPIAGEPTGLDIGIETTLENYPEENVEGNVDFPGPFPQTLGVATVIVAVRDAGGLVHTFDGRGRVQAAVVDQRIGVPLTFQLAGGESVTPDYPIELLGIQIVLELPADTRVAGDIEMTSVTATAGEASSSIDLVPSRDGWTWLVERGLAAPEPATTVDGRPERVRFAEGQPLFGGEGIVVLRLVPATLADAATRQLPILISRSFADQTRAGVGDSVAIGSLTRRTQVEIVAIVDGFPTLDPEQPFAVVDLGGLALATYARSGEDLFTDEWWLDASDEAAAAATLSDDPYSAEAIISRAELSRGLTDDPVALGVIGALAIGSVAALIVAVIGFVVSAVVSTRERLGEFALLRALGLSRSQLSAWLTLENAFLLGTGVVAGTGLGLVLAWLVLPFVTLTREARIVVPPVIVEISWAAIGAVGLVAALALGVAVVVIGGVLRRVPVSGVLRAGQD